MEVQYYDVTQMDFETRKKSQNTCHSSNDGSPNLNGEMHDESDVKLLRTFSTGTSSPESYNTPEKVFQSSSMDNFSYLQKRASEMIVESKIGDQNKNMKYQTTQKTKKTQDLCENKRDTMQTSRNQDATTGQQFGVQIRPVIIKSDILAPLSQNQKIKIDQKEKQNKNFLSLQQTKNKSQNSSHITKSKPQSQQPLSPQKKDTRPLPSYKQARQALYVWVRNLCSQMNMCFDVFGLTMKYLDEYHITYGYAYDRTTFSPNVYALIILASKLMNKKILTPKVIAEKSKVTRQQLQQIQIKMINLMNYKLYFETYIKLMQRKCEKWQQICKKRQLESEFSMFKQNLCSFKRFYLLVRQVEICARQKFEVTNEMLLEAFITSLGWEFKTKNKQETLCEILYETFESTQNQGEYMFGSELICKKIEQGPSSDECSFQLCEMINKNFQRRNNKQFYPTYSVFLNSIFEMKF